MKVIDLDNARVADLQELVGSWRDWNHDYVQVERSEEIRGFVARVVQGCEPFRTSAVVHAKSRRAAIAGLAAVLEQGPHGRRP